MVIARIVLALTVFVAGCGSSPKAEYPALNGRRVQGTSVAAHGGVPYRVGAYELVFVDLPHPDAHVRRAALVVDLPGAQGQVRGFVEWGRSGEAPLMYVAGGWARQTDVRGELVTVFELALSYLEARTVRARAPEAERSTPLSIRVVVVVNETSGDVTLKRRH